MLLPALAWLVSGGHWNAKPWLLSLAFGSLLAFIYVVYQVLGLSMSRAAIATDNPISFGKIAIMFGTVALLTGVMLPSAGAQARSKGCSC
jgi:hypothetical protein